VWVCGCGCGGGGACVVGMWGVGVGGYENMALRVTLAVPPGYSDSIDVAQVKKVFPYGKCHLVFTNVSWIFDWRQLDIQ
jgi:hypothetical protein